MSFEFSPNNHTSLNDCVPRRSANFEPSAWGDYFLSFTSNTMEEDDAVRKHCEELKEEVRNMLATAEKCSKKLKLIDLIQRLGLSYHFEGEINEILDHIHNSCEADLDEDLYIMTLRFRLLRQQGYFVSSEIFNKFTDETGAFKESIVEDKTCLLSLYEASHLRINGENILDKALAFTTARLREMAMDSSSCFGEEVKYALKWPIFKAFPRLMSKHHISLYNNDPLHNNVLLTFAKLDYNLLQKLYQKEVAELTRWMKDLKLMERLSFARDRTLEVYVWALGALYEPKYSRARILFAKLIMIISVLDDTFDVYATFDELESFTQAIERWDVNDIEMLPNYMKFLYQAIFDYYKEIEQGIICKEYNIPLLALDYAKYQVKRLCKAYLMEAKWFHEGYVPSMEEYMKVATITSVIYAFSSTLFLYLGNVSSKEVFQWANNDPMLMKATGVMGRLMNDITSHKFEQERGHVASAVECYMKQYSEFEEEEVVIELEKQVAKTWKDLTQDYIKSCREIPNVFLVRILNIARITNLFYKKEDGYTFADGDTKHFITSMLVDQVLI